MGMSVSRTRIACVVTLATTMALLAAAPGGQRGAAGTKPIPRAADGKPDLSGIWIAGSQPLLIGEAAARAIQEADKAAGRAAPLREPPPYNPAAEAKRQEYVARRGIDDQ